jgi:hypothetical protein
MKTPDTNQPDKRSETLFPEPGSRSRGHSRPAGRHLLVVLLLSAAAVALLILTGACGGDDSSNATGSPTGSAAASPSGSEAALSPTPEGETPAPEQRTPTPTLGPSFVPGCTAVGLTSELDVGPALFPLGQPIPIAMTLKNCGDNIVHLFYPSSQRYEFYAQNDSGLEVWRWATNQVFDQAKGEEQIAVGQSVVYKETWDQLDTKRKQVPAGRYKIFAFSVGCSDAASSNCTFGPVGYVDINP